MKQKLLALAAALVLLLSGCQLNIQPEGTTFAYALLCSRYFGEVSEEYTRLALASPEQAAEDYEDMVAAEMVYFCAYFGVAAENADQASLRRFVEAAYGRISFLVGQQQVGDGVISVPVTVQPLRLFDHIGKEEYMAVVGPLWEQFGAADGTGLSALSAVQRSRYERAYLSGILAMVEGRLAEAVYGEARTVTLRLEQDGDYYRPNAEDLAAIHALTLGYE